MRTMLFLALAAGLATPSLASDRTGFLAISAGDYQKAEERLVVERRIFPRRPELMINLATVYARTGRLAEAANLYRSALNTAPVEMVLPDGGVASSRTVAQRGLDSLGGVSLARR
ncbi:MULTISPECIES: tetratricopeptide repeat protein [unclassified Sphingomonas]|uniref:tetratricopeptide repeat protein n=1 Tax=unclassified Sphingomonas TaxID=196159 RepID=UPI001D1081E0|nr:MULTISPECIES: tetratricopeptide repeat protein [unclassified Sphingomonas]MCC2978702.1 tetratricopeptide repeat protein [Sphingomonas sp. IC4-52]MCD2316011.1 tetratricopeptide repeat protein [Sphingomonas sp. IC-11]